MVKNYFLGLCIFILLVCSVNVFAGDYDYFNPIMTSYNAPSPYYVKNSSYVNPTQPGWTVFNGVYPTDPVAWQSATTAYGWVQLDLGANNLSRLTKYAICTFNNANYKPTAWNVYVSNSSVPLSGYNVSNRSGQSLTQNTCTNYTVDSTYLNLQARYITLEVLANSGGSATLVGEMLLYFNTTVASTNISFDSISPYNNTYTYNNTPNFVGNITYIPGSWNISLLINDSIKSTQNGISTTGLFNFTSSALTANQEYLWWFNATDATNISKSFITEKRLLYVAGTTNVTATSCLVNLGLAYFRPNNCQGY